MYEKISEYPEVRFDLSFLFQNYIYSEDVDPEEREKYKTAGCKLIADGKVALVLLSGGQVWVF